MIVIDKDISDLEKNLVLKQNMFIMNPSWSSSVKTQLYAGVLKINQSLSESQKTIYLATSGTTEVGPKLVALSYSALESSAEAVNKHLSIQSDDNWLVALPLFHAGGLGILFRSILQNNKVYYYGNYKWNPQRFADLLHDYRIQWCSLVPTQIYDLVKAQLVAPQFLKGVVVGGDYFSETLYLQSRQLGWPVLPSYGMTETASQVATARLSSLLKQQMPLGDILSHADINVDSESRIKIKSTSLLTCYGQWQGDHFKIWDPKIDGYLVTSDLGQVVDQKLQVWGRELDRIKVKGELTHRIKLQGLWDQLIFQKKLNLVAVIVPIPNERLGHEIVLVVEKSKSNLDEKQTKIENEVLLSHIRTCVEDFNKSVMHFEKIIRIEAIAWIPKNAMGKVLVKQLIQELI